ncbi:hypothetical protein QOZ80_6BG0467060 [Eleusine coracana subsp. coracana]|nr:hypothetical protein QOZ80_6BG0467060 [Eleusine coracana subsp. coracana]
MLPLVSAVLADSYWDRYSTITVSSVLYVLKKKMQVKGGEVKSGSAKPNHGNRTPKVDEAAPSMAKIILGLLPIWTMMLMFAVIFQQTTTFFTKQGTLMHHTVGGGAFIIPPATLQSSITVSTILLMPITCCWAFRTCSRWWLVGMQEFFYTRVPAAMRTVGIALYLSVFGVGSFLGAFLITALEMATAKDGDGRGWFSDDPKEAHLDKYYWFLTLLSSVSFVVFLHLCNYYRSTDASPSGK